MECLQLSVNKGVLKTILQCNNPSRRGNRQSFPRSLASSTFAYLPDNLKIQRTSRRIVFQPDRGYLSLIFASPNRFVQDQVWSAIKKQEIPGHWHSRLESLLFYSLCATSCDKLRQAHVASRGTWEHGLRTCERGQRILIFIPSPHSNAALVRRVASHRTSTSSHLHVRMPALPRHRKITKRIQEQKKKRWKAISIAARFKRNRISNRSNFLPLSQTSSSCIMSFLLSSFVKSNIISQRYQERSSPNKLLRTVSEWSAMNLGRYLVKRGLGREFQRTGW